MIVNRVRSKKRFNQLNRFWDFKIKIETIKREIKKDWRKAILTRLKIVSFLKNIKRITNPKIAIVPIKEALKEA